MFSDEALQFSRDLAPNATFAHLVKMTASQYVYIYLKTEKGEGMNCIE